MSSSGVKVRDSGAMPPGTAKDGTLTLIDCRTDRTKIQNIVYPVLVQVEWWALRRMDVSYKNCDPPDQKKRERGRKALSFHGRPIFDN